MQFSSQFDNKLKNKFYMFSEEYYKCYGIMKPYKINGIEFLILEQFKLKEHTCSGIAIPAHIHYDDKIYFSYFYHENPMFSFKNSRILFVFETERELLKWKLLT